MADKEKKRKSGKKIFRIVPFLIVARDTNMGAMIDDLNDGVSVSNALADVRSPNLNTLKDTWICRFVRKGTGPMPIPFVKDITLL